MEPLKHECGVAMIRLLKPLEYYQEKYGTWMYGLNKLYLMMEKQHNRGQEGAGLACVKLDYRPGHEYMFRERAEGKDAITKIFGTGIVRLTSHSLHQSEVGTAIDERMTLMAYPAAKLTGSIKKLGGNVVIGRTENADIHFHSTFSRHGRAQASLALLIWLIENVHEFFCLQSLS